MIRMDAATVFVGWAAGLLVWQLAVGIFTRVHFGAAWVIRVFAIIFASCALVAAAVGGWNLARDVGAAIVLVVTVVALGISYAGHRAEQARLDDRDPAIDSTAAAAARSRLGDLVAAVVGLGAVVVGAVDAGGPVGLAVARMLVGAAVLGGLTFTMIFSHRLLAKPYLGREPFEVATTGLLIVWPVEIIVMMIPTGMVSVLTGAVDDGYMGILGWMWAMCAVATGGLLIVTRVILADRAESKLASASGMIYLAALTGWGTVLISRAVLSG